MREMMKAKWVAADGTVLVGDMGGNPQDPPVVLLHGGGQTRHSWDGAMRALIDASYFVINFDARGHGESGWSADGVYSYAIRAQDLNTVLNGVARPPTLVGASMGGATAIRAFVDGMDLQALVLVDLVLRPERRGLERIRNFMLANPGGFASLEEAAASVMAYNPRRLKPPKLDGLRRNLRVGTEGRLFWHWDPRILPADTDSDMAALESLIDRLASAPSIDTLLVRGVHSDVVSEASIDDLRAVVQHLKVVDIVGAGHMVAGDDNNAFNDAVIGFLRSQR